MTPVSRRSEIPPGTLDMLILSTLARALAAARNAELPGELHGFEIAEAIERRSVGVFLIEEGSLYPALQRMLIKGWIVGEWARTADNRRARYYRITAPGRKQLAREMTAYERASAAIARVLRPTMVTS